jgi:hypothetical protein
MRAAIGNRATAGVVQGSTGGVPVQRYNTDEHVDLGKTEQFIGPEERSRRPSTKWPSC